MNCIYCGTHQPEKGFYCPNCFKQTKCKHCSESLLKDAKICVMCGEDLVQKTATSNINTIEFSESETGRNFKASFTNEVGQSISDAFGVILVNKIGSKKNLPPTLHLSNEGHSEIHSAISEAQVINAPLISTNQVNTNIPTLKDVKLRDLAKNETDWFVVYAHFASEGGTKEFTRSNIIELYQETQRKTPQRIKNLSQLFKNVTKSQFVKPINDTNFILLDKGKVKAHEIFDGNSNSKTSKKGSMGFISTKSKKDTKQVSTEIKQKKGKSSNSIEFIDLRLTVPEQKLLTDFFQTKKPSSQNEKVLVAMKWFIDHKKVEEISLEEINYLLSIAAETPSALAQVLGNMVGSKFRWVTKGSVGKYRLGSIGENYIQNTLPK